MLYESLCEALRAAQGESQGESQRSVHAMSEALSLCATATAQRKDEKQRGFVVERITERFYPLGSESQTRHTAQTSHGPAGGSFRGDSYFSLALPSNQVLLPGIPLPDSVIVWTPPIRWSQRQVEAHTYER